ncbi:MAG: hypothetical protein PHI37_00630 [Candidatus Gracilibacteria bacterium]|nr:hypothetical protein [Candidatus Gracilibacteria bacterium]
MYKVTFKPDVYDYLLKYFNKYREYYENLYEDSGIWSENQIIDGYIEESKNRNIEILDLIEETLDKENILGRKENNSLIIRWRTKYLFIEFLEDANLKERYVSSLSIR